MDKDDLTFTISIGKAIETIFSLLVVATVLTLIMRAAYPTSFFGDSLLRPFFNFDAENSFPTWLASILLFLCAVLLFVIGKYEREQKQPFASYWVGLSCIFLLLSLDEIATVHENLGGPLKDWFELSGAFYYAWIVPVAFIIVALVVVYLRFFMQLPKKFKLTISLAAVLFIGGALGLEMIEGYLAYLDEANKDRWPYFLITLIEELLEFTGVSVFLYALLNHVRSLKCNVKILVR